MSQSNAETVQSNAQRIQSGYEAFAAGDIPAVVALFSDDIAWDIPGSSPLSGTYNGPDEVLGFFQQLGERSGGTFTLEVHDILDNGDDKVALLVTENAQRGDKSLSQSQVHVWSLRDGKATTFRAFAEDDAVNDEFWS